VQVRGEYEGGRYKRRKERKGDVEKMKQGELKRTGEGE
jgi:hypothetical protein